MGDFSELDESVLTYLTTARQHDPVYKLKDLRVQEKQFEKKELQAEVEKALEKLPLDYEIIVVVDGRVDKTAEIVRRIKIKNKKLDELHPFLWPFANQNLKVKELEQIIQGQRMRFARAAKMGLAIVQSKKVKIREEILIKL